MSKRRSTLSTAAAYPATNYAPRPLRDLSRPEERRALSAPALRAFFNIMERWKIRDQDARLLLGGVSNGAFYQWKQNPDKLLDQDRLLRISYLVGIFKALNILYGESLADSWVLLANQNPLFTGRTPLEYMIQGGTPAMDYVRQLLDGRRGG